MFLLDSMGFCCSPKADSFVDDTAIKAFIAFKVRSKNPVTVILVDTYTSLDSFRKMEVGSMLPACFVCLADSHFEERVVGIKCPMESIKQQRLEMKGAGGRA